MTDYQDQDLAYLQDAAFGKIASHAGNFLLNTFHHYSNHKGLVLDLGCGSGKLIDMLSQDGYKTLGVDISNGSIELAKKRTPNGSFICDSIFNINIPESQYVISTDITLNYLPREQEYSYLLKELFNKIYNALLKDGLLIFDILIVNDDMPSRNQTRFMDNPDWSVFIERVEDRQAQTITREITLFRKIENVYRKSQRTDITTAFNLDKILSMLEEIGFSVRTFHHYGSFKFNSDHVGIICKK